LHAVHLDDIWTCCRHNLCPPSLQWHPRVQSPKLHCIHWIQWGQHNSVQDGLHVVQAFRFVSKQCQQYMPGPTVTFAVGALHMLVRALHLHQVLFSFVCTGVLPSQLQTSPSVHVVFFCCALLLYILHFGSCGFSSARFVRRFVCVSQAPCWEGESLGRDTAWPVVACIACVMPMVHCIRLIPAAMLSCKMSATAD
jgi:hypothetical protein